MIDLASSLKGTEVEEPIDLYFFRPLGFLISRRLRFTRVTPTHVTAVSIVFGVLSGHLLYYDDPWLDLLAVLAFVTANLLDSVDGQLARITDQSTRLGRILDGVAGGIMFTSIHLHLALRLYQGGEGLLIFALVLVALLSQSYQNATVDYYKNAFLAYGMRGGGGELEAVGGLEGRQLGERGRTPGLQSWLLRQYAAYTARQERMTPRFQRLRKKLAGVGGSEAFQDWFAGRYRLLCKPLLKHNAWIATNLRMALLFALVFLDRVVWYFWFDIIVLNGIMCWIIAAHERRSDQLAVEVAGWERAQGA